MPSRSHNYESNGPEARVRGNASQVYEKYLQLARDTQSGGDRVLAESFMQHAEHYYRILNESTDPNNRPQHRDVRHEDRAEERDRDSEDDQPNGYNGDQQPLTPGRSVSRFDDRRQEARSGDPRYTEPQRAEQDTQRAEAVAEAAEEPAAPVVAGAKTAAASAAADGQGDKGETETAKPVRRTRRSPTRRTTKSKSDEAAGGDEDAGLLKMLGESPRPNGDGGQTPEASPKTSSETSQEASSQGSPGGSPESSGEKAAAQPAEEAEAKPAPKPRRRRTTKSSGEAANVDA